MFFFLSPLPTVNFILSTKMYTVMYKWTFDFVVKLSFKIEQFSTVRFHLNPLHRTTMDLKYDDFLFIH